MKIRLLFICLLFITSTSFAEVDSLIIDGDGSGLKAHVHGFSTAARDDHAGLLVLTRTFQDFIPEFHPFLNDNFGIAMNQNVAFSGSPEIIHNGLTSTEWTGVIVQGTWDFADGGEISLTTADNNDEAEFQEEGGTFVEWDNFTALTGKIDLDIYNSVNNDLLIEFDLTGVIVGNSVNLNDFIDTGDFAQQSFVIPKADLGLTTQPVDGFNILLQRTGGSKPTMKFDDIQMEAAGEPAVFKATTPLGTRFHITELRIRVEDDVSSVLTDGSMPNIDPNAILGVSALSNGIVFSSKRQGETIFAVTIKDLGDFLATGSNLINVTGNATNTGLTLVIMFPEPIVLQGGESENFLSFTINDNLSTLTRFTAAARGALER